MKKYVGLFMLFAAGGTFVSCEDDLLDPYSPGAVTEEVIFQTPSDLETLLNTAYSYLTPTAEIAFNSAFTDEVGIGFANGGQGLGDNYDFLINANSDSPKGIWSGNYITLSVVNRAIKFADIVTVADNADQQLLNRVKAEALTLRAHIHNQLTAYFSPNPKDRNALGIILSNDVYPIGILANRTTNGVIYDQIDADLAEATSLYATVTTAADPIKANINFTNGLKARTFALRGDYPNALIAADNVINTSGLSLATFSTLGTGYLSVFHTDTNNDNIEVIFKLEKQNGETRTGAIWASVNSTVNGSPFFEIGRSLFNQLNTTMRPDATPLTITAIAGQNITIPGHNLQVNDMFVSMQSLPSNASTTNGSSTIPANALLAGKVYWVKSVTPTSIQLTDTAFGTTTFNFAAANGTGLSVPAMANAGDIRYATLVHPTSIINPNYQTVEDFRNTDKLAFRKYPGTASNGLLVNDVKIMRLTEMYLIRAEAQIAAGLLGDAAVTIKQVRDARFNRPQALPVYGDATAAWKDVLLERRKDFAAEGYRYIDLKRLGALANEGIERDPRDCEINGACSLPVTDFRFTLPIPTDESNPNPGFGEQNPGY